MSGGGSNLVLRQRLARCVEVSTRMANALELARAQARALTKGWRGLFLSRRVRAALLAIEEDSDAALYPIEKHAQRQQGGHGNP